MKKLNEKEVTKFLIYLQDYCGVEANIIATKKVKEWGLRKEHQKQTGNPDSAYEEIKTN